MKKSNAGRKRLYPLTQKLTTVKIPVEIRDNVKQLIKEYQIKIGLRK